VAFEKPAGVPAVGKFSNMLKFIVKGVLMMLILLPATLFFLYPSLVLNFELYINACCSL